jgi:endonuclease YncB( thermonuclease family)
MLRSTGILLLLAAAAAAHAGDVSLQGTARLIDGNTLDIDGQAVVLDGIQPIGSTRLCPVGKRRMPCATLAEAELGPLIASQSVSCDLTGSDGLGRAVGRCRVAGVELSAILIERGLADPMPTTEITVTDEDAIEPALPTPDSAQGGPELKLVPAPAASEPAPVAKAAPEPRQAPPRPSHASPRAPTF